MNEQSERETDRQTESQRQRRASNIDRFVKLYKDDETRCVSVFIETVIRHFKILKKECLHTTE
jgi:hypothetical protein